MELQIADVQAALAKLLNHYPESGHNEKTIAILAFDWHDLLIDEGVTQDQFFHGIRHAAKTCRFFPKVADVLDGVKSYRANPPRRISVAMQIEEHTATAANMTTEELERNRERVLMIADALAGRLSWDEAERSVARVGKIVEFSAQPARGRR